MELVGADVLGSEPVGRAPVEGGEPGDQADVHLDGARRVFAGPQILDHSLAQWGHDVPPFKAGGWAPTSLTRRRAPCYAAPDSPTPGLPRAPRSSRGTLTAERSEAVSFNPNFGFQLLLPVFAGVVLGGVGSAYGALAGGLVLGVAMELSTWPALAGGVDPVYKPVVAFVVLIAALMVRPQGLFGRARFV